jgi:hypothetical protein
MFHLFRYYWSHLEKCIEKVHRQTSLIDVYLVLQSQLRVRLRDDHTCMRKQICFCCS